MKGHIEVISALKSVLTNELSSINQYFLHARMCKNKGYDKLASKFYKEALDEMKHARDIIDRILFLEGVPNVEKLHPLNIGETVKKQLENDLGLEEKAIVCLKKGIETCVKHSDFASQELLQNILLVEEAHADWLESQLSLMKELGEANYLSRQFSVEGG